MALSVRVNAPQRRCRDDDIDLFSRAEVSLDRHIDHRPLCTRQVRIAFLWVAMDFASGRCCPYWVSSST